MRQEYSLLVEYFFRSYQLSLFLEKKRVRRDRIQAEIQEMLQECTVDVTSDYPRVPRQAKNK